VSIIGTEQLFLFISIGCITGILTGFTGASGMSVLISGLLLAGVTVREVIALTFVVTMANSVIASLPYARRGNIPMLPAVLMGGAAAGAVFVGYRISFALSSAVLEWFIVAGLAAAGVKFTLFDKKTAVDISQETFALPLWTLVIPGAVIGCIMGILGGGGGVFIALVLIFVYRIAAHKALGISLVVMFLAALPGGYLYARDGFIEASSALTIIVPSTVCSFFASRCANRLSDRTVKRVLGVYLLIISLVIAGKNLGLFGGLGK
jgi:uncharacterized protein